MSPSAISVEQTTIPIVSTTKLPKPLKSSGSLDQYESIDITPIIGTEYPTVKLVDLINAPNADELLRDLAIKSNN